MNRARILILGAGERVRQDLLPVLVALGYQDSDLLILRKNNDQLLEFPQFMCTTMNGPKIKGFNPELIISCLPTVETIKVIREVMIFTCPYHLFVDTPITKIYRDLIELNTPKGVSVLEDNHLVFFASQLAKVQPRLIFVKKALYDYHGVALLSKTFGKPSKRHFKIRIRNFLFLTFKVGNTIVIWMGPRKYDKIGRAHV